MIITRVQDINAQPGMIITHHMGCKAKLPNNSLSKNIRVFPEISPFPSFLSSPTFSFLNSAMEASPIVAAHVVAMPYPGRGHVNPLMNLCNLLASKHTDIRVTFVVTEEWLDLIGSGPKPDNVRFGSIPNIIPPEKSRGKDFLAFYEAVMTKMETPFEELLDRLEPPPTVVIYDTYLLWVVGVGNRRNIPVASFFPMSASFFSTLQHYDLLDQNGHYPVNSSENGDKRVDYFPGLSPTRLVDFPLVDSSFQSKQLLRWALKAFQWVTKAQYLLFTSIYELEPQIIDILKSELSLPIYPIGPAIPYFSLEDKHSSPSPNHIDLSYLQWLNSQPSESVLYISQGSFLSASGAQIEEIAAGLRESGVRFLWVARGEGSRLKEICGDMGLVLAWCDQLRVLLHPAIGGFWSHCGWNSTKEGIFAGIPFLTCPILMDQPLNSKMIVEDWKIGWRVKKDFNVDTIVRKDEIASLLNKFMDLDSDEGREMRRKAKELQKICQLAIASGGSADININAFVRDVLQSAKTFAL